MNQYKQKATRNTAKLATVTATNGLQLVGDGAHRNLRVVAPYGIQTKPVVGSTVALLPLSSGEYLLLGAVGEDNALQAGELRLQNSAGATILLKSDGSISLNGLIISSDGQIGGV